MKFDKNKKKKLFANNQKYDPPPQHRFYHKYLQIHSPLQNGRGPRPSNISHKVLK